MKTKAGKRQNFFICQRSKARWDLFPLPPIICKYSWEKVVGVVWREEIVSIFMWKLLQQPVAVYWLNEFNLLQFLFSFFPITFEKDFFFPATVVAAVARAINTFFSVSFAKWRCECALVQPPMRGLSTFMGNSNSRPRYDNNLHQIQIGSFGFWWFADETTSEDEKLVNWIILIAFEHHSGPRLDGSDRGHKIGINYRALFLAFHIFRAHLMAVLRGVECVVRCPKHLHSTLNYYFQFPFHLRLYSLDRANKFAIFWQIQRKRF